MFTDADVIYKHNLLSPQTMLRSARLLLFTRIIKKSPRLLVDWIEALLPLSPSGWLSALGGDFQWLAAGGIVEHNHNLQWHYSNSVCDPSGLSRRIRRYSRQPFANVDVPFIINPVFGSPSFKIHTCPHCFLVSNIYQKTDVASLKTWL